MLLRGLGIPLWTDLIGNGYPIFAEGQMGELYPLHALLYVLPFKTISLFNFNLMLHYMLAGIFTYLYIKICIKISQITSVLGALIFTFSGYMLTHLHQVNIILELTYFPLDLLIAETLLKTTLQTSNRKKVGFFVLFTLIIYLQITAGHIEMVYYNLLFMAIYMAIRFFLTKKVREIVTVKAIIAISSLVVACLLALPQLYATFELVNFSQREAGISYESTTGTLWPVETLILFINPKAYNVYRDEPGYSPNKAETVNIGALYPYIGLLPLGLTAIAIIGLLKKQKDKSEIENSSKIWTVTFLILLVFTYLYAVGRSTQLFSLVWELIPGMKFFRFPVKAIYIIEFCLAVLASIGLQNINDYIASKGKKQETKDTRNRAISSDINSYKEGVTIARRRNYAGIMSLANIISVLIICICFVDLRISNGPTQPTIPAGDWLKTPKFAQFINSQDPDCYCEIELNKYPQTAADNQAAIKFQNWRTYSHGTNNIDYTRIFDIPLQKDLQNIVHMDFNMIHDISLNREWAVLFLQRQTILNKFNTKINLEKGELGLPPDLKKSLDLQSVRYLIADLPLIDPNLELIKTHQFSSKVNHVLFMANSTDSSKIPTDKAYLYRNKSYFPRITITPQANAIFMNSDGKAGQNLLEKVLSPEFDPTKQTVIEDSNFSKTTKDNNPFIANYKIRSYDPQNIVVQVESTSDAFFAMSDTYYPGWGATVDGKEAKVERANFAFKAVAVPAGNHIVAMKFQPTHWNITILCVIAGWSIVATSSVYILINYLKSKHAKTTF